LLDASAAFGLTIPQSLFDRGRPGHIVQANALHGQIRASKRLPWVELDPTRVHHPEFMPEPVERNARWRVVVRHLLEIDE
jgi:hypothetical protein